MDEFFPQHKESAQVTNKKRKAEKPLIDEDLRKRAQLYCTCPAEWRSVSKYGNQRLQEFVLENEFRQAQSLQLQVFDFVQRGLAFVTDKLSAGGGYVQEQIEQDQNLRTAIQAEAGSFLCLLNNKVKLFALMAADTATGKMNQKLKEPQIIEIKENDNEAPVFFREDTRQAPANMPFGGEIPRDSVCPEAVDNAGGWAQRDGEEPDDSLSLEGPEGTEIPL
jgi:hypothetical protein